MPGSWTKRGKDSYRLSVCIGADLKGNPNRYTKTVHCKTDAQADKELAKFYAACESGSVAKGSKATVSAFCDKWLQDYAKVKVKATTYTKYDGIIKNHIKPVIGDRKINTIKAVHLQEWVKLLSDGGLTPKAIHDYFSLLNTIFSTAVKWDFISSNPCVKVDLMPVIKEEADYYNKEEVTLLLDKLMQLPTEETRYKVGIIMDLFTGLRASELMGLRWEDIDLEKRELKVKINRQYVSKKIGVVEDTPKTKKSARTISMPEICVTMLKELQHEQKKQKVKVGSKWDGSSDFVFLNDFGEPMFPRYLSKWFTAFIEREGLRKITFHQLRHTHTSILDYLNVSETQISKRLGHSQLSTTRNTYTHIFNNTDKESADKMDVFFKDVSSK